MKGLCVLLCSSFHRIRAIYALAKGRGRACSLAGLAFAGFVGCGVDERRGASERSCDGSDVPQCVD